MNSGLLKFIAIILALAAIGMGWLGYRLSNQPAPAATAVAAPTYEHLVASRDIAPGETLAEADLKVAIFQQRQSQAFDQQRQVIGKIAVRPIKTGSLLQTSDFLRLSELAKALLPDERAIAVKVNEVVGVGGFIKPGDHVDVLLYLRADRETNDTSSAQLLLSDVRVLAYGDEIGDDSAPNAKSTEEGKTTNLIGDSVKKYDSVKGKAGKSAILAVPSQNVSRLVLADNSGMLRLAVRVPEAVKVASPDNAQFVRLQEVAGVKPAIGQVSQSSAVPTVRRSTSKQGESGLNQVKVYRGDKVEIVNVK